MSVLNAVYFKQKSLLVASHALLEMIADLQSERMDEQRAQLPGLVTRRTGASPASAAAGSSNATSHRSAASNVSQIQSKLLGHQPAADDAFIDMLMRCQVNRHLIILRILMLDYL